MDQCELILTNAPWKKIFFLFTALCFILGSLVFLVSTENAKSSLLVDSADSLKEISRAFLSILELREKNNSSIDIEFPKSERIPDYKEYQD